MALLGIKLLLSVHLVLLTNKQKAIIYCFMVGHAFLIGDSFIFNDSYFTMTLLHSHQFKPDLTDTRDLE